MSTGEAWRRDEGRSVLSSGEVHVWRFRVDAPADRARLTCRQRLAALLGRYAGVAPDRIRLIAGAYGKPGIEPGGPGEGIEFNLSHSGGLALIAISLGRRVGVDLEEIRPDIALGDLARGLFTAEEQQRLRQLEGDAGIREFFAFWTRKEAQIKAWGGSIAALQAGASGPPGEWHLRDLPVGDGYAGALCVDGRPSQVFLWEDA